MADDKPFNYRYPLTKLTSSDDYLKITVLQYKPPGFIPEGESFAAPTAGEIQGYASSTPKGYILLPIPDTIQDSNSAQWGPSTLNPVQVAIGAGAQSLLGQTSVESALSGFENTTKRILNSFNSGSVQKYFTSEVITKGTNVLFPGENRLELQNVLARTAGQVINSNIELIFSGVRIREPFTFGFDIVPRSKKESDMVKAIIKKFKFHSAAKKQTGAAAGLFLKAPEVFKLEYMSGNKSHPFLNKFKICALNGMSVNYTGSGTYATYADATPVNMVLTLVFQELTPIYADDYTTNIGDEGTGY
jgi:hypothetical protein